MRDGLSGPELVVGHPAHDFVTHGRWSVVFPGRVEISCHHKRIVISFEILRVKPAICFFAARRRTFVFQMCRDDRRLSRGRIRNGYVDNQRHAATLTHFALDSFPEQPLRSPTLAFLQLGGFFRLLSEPVVAHGQAQDTRTSNRIAAQDRRAMKAEVAFVIDV